MIITIEKRRGKYMQRKKLLHKTRRNVISTKIKQQTATKIEMLYEDLEERRLQTQRNDK